MPTQTTPTPKKTNEPTLNFTRADAKTDDAKYVGVGWLKDSRFGNKFISVALEKPLTPGEYYCQARKGHSDAFSMLDSQDATALKEAVICSVRHKPRDGTAKYVGKAYLRKNQYGSSLLVKITEEVKLTDKRKNAKGEEVATASVYISPTKEHDKILG